MKLEKGTKLGHYEILSPIGLGGLGRSVTENKIRGEAGLPTRTTYGGL